MERIVKLGDVLKYEQPTKYIVKSTLYNDNYSTPVLTAGQTFILGYTNETDGIFTKTPVIIFDDFTTAIKYVDFPFKVKSSAMKILSAEEKLANIRYLYYKMQTIKNNNSEHKRYWISKYAELEIPLPPLPIQQKIAAILDAADELRQKDKVLVAKYDELSRALFLELFGDPVSNPKGWAIKRMEEVCIKITDGTHFSPEPQSEGYPYVTAKHVKEYGLDFYAKPTYISKKAHDEIYKRCTPEHGDVLYIKDGATTGIACLNTFKEPISLLSSLALLKPNKTVLNNYYLSYWLNNPKNKIALINEFMSGAAIQRYTLSKINSFMVMVPDLRLQNKFAELVKDIESQKKSAQECVLKSEELFNSLLQKAFNGELV